MLKRKLILVFSLFLILGGVKQLNAQVNNSVAILLNEYSATNLNTGIIDAFGNQSDWVELLCDHNFSVSLQSYYLSNDRNNLKKWAFPSTFTMSAHGIRTLFLSGKNTVKNGEYHTNFTLDQCKNQWLILSTSTGVVRDSVFVQKTMAGHTRGRLDPFVKGVGAWRLYTGNSFGLPNPMLPGSYYKDYAPTPSFTPATVYNNTVNAGGFFPPSNPINQIDIFLGGIADSSGSCFEVHYTLDGSIPSPIVGGSTQLYTVLAPIIIVNTTIVRAIAFTSTASTWPNCTSDYLPSFCQTNTYFTDQEHNDFSSDFGVMSLAINTADTGWFNAGGVNPGPIIHAEYYDKKNQISEGYAQITRPPNEAWLTKQKGFFITIDDRRGFGCNFEGDIFNVEGLGTTPRRSFYTLHLKSGDYESHSSVPSPTNGGISFGTGIRDVFIQSLAAKNNLNVNPLHIKPVVAFINGKYRGVYDLRECYDVEYEAFYNKQSRDSVQMNFYYNNDGTVTPPITGNANWRTEVYNKVCGSGTNPGNPAGTPMNNLNAYNNVMLYLDKQSFMDYMILNSYTMNSDLWNYNVAFAKGGQANKPGNKWHYYLWNMPATFNFTAVATNTLIHQSPYTTPCTVHSNTYSASQYAGNGHGNILKVLMQPVTGNAGFQLEYKNRYQDLLNGPLKCENLLAHFDYVKNLFLKEMKYHEDPASIPQPGEYITAMDLWDTLTSQVRRTIFTRCDYFKGGTPANGFNVSGCYGMTGPFDLTVDVKPEGAGKVRVNTLLLENYTWNGRYYSTTMPLKAIPMDTTFVFHHWEFEKHIPLNGRPLSLDSVAIGFNQADRIVAVFTDKKNDVEMPTGFSPNGDNNNDVFMPLGSAAFAKEFDFRIWNRWGQEVFRSTDPSLGWDGNFKGQPSITGVYAYVITYKNIYNESKMLKGNVTLVR
ncbi:MAG: gliding motility-associated C-terminal domain-containing protein [Bacteroidia bacterium]|nr:gliding motility-associated C-terminal domain-containing protein [Bacteroidia bacterium]